MTLDLTIDTFTKLQGEKFLFLRTFDEPKDWPSPVEVELVEVTDLAGRTETGIPDRHPFSLIFRGDLDCPMGPYMHTVEHQTLGRFDLCIAPVMYERGDPAKPTAMFYEAVFN